MLEDRETIRRRWADRVARCWNDLGLRYIVVNGLSHYPQKVGRDLDVVVLPEDIPLALRGISMVAQELGVYVFHRWSYHGLHQAVMILSQAEPCSLPIDLFCTDQVWRSKMIPVTNSVEIISQPFEYIGPFRINSYSDFLKNILRPLLVGNIDRFKDNYPLPIDISDPSLNEKIHDMVGAEGLAIVKKLLQGSFDDLKENISQDLPLLRRMYFFRHPKNALRSYGYSIASKFMFALFVRPIVGVFFCSRLTEEIEPLKKKLKMAFLETEVAKRSANGFFYHAPKMMIEGEIAGRNPPASEFRFFLWVIEDATQKESRWRRRVQKLLKANFGVVDDCVTPVVKQLVQAFQEAQVCAYRPHDFS